MRLSTEGQIKERDARRRHTRGGRALCVYGAWCLVDKQFCLPGQFPTCSLAVTRTTGLEGELFNADWILIKVAVANPPRPDHEIRDVGPAKVAAAFWPSGEIHFLVVRKRGSLGLARFALVLHRDFACPPNHERTMGIRHQILKLARTLDGIEDDLQFRSYSNSHEGRLRDATWRKGRQHSKLLFRNQLVD